ncbi:MAG: hypothetical protein IT373_32395 [Polyangiaceae bacterium]|nr:hypothetical protein [Polyangiaceae bacterium]
MFQGTGTTTTGTGGAGGSGGQSGAATRVDLLLAVDNSRSMADKQEILGLAVPTLVESLVNPRCLDADGVPAASQPSGAGQACTPGTHRQFAPVTDLHVGVLSTSLGGHGANICEGSVDPSENDQGHLLSRDDQGGSVATYESLGFLAWDPDQVLSPPGESDPGALSEDLASMVRGVGQVGCGFEATLESWYRFLVEPNPHSSISIDAQNNAVLVGTDYTVLDQRRAFLRPDSALAILMLSDENDCSLRDGSQYYFAAQLQVNGSAYHLPKPRAACAVDPNDPCCRSCGQPAGAGCSTAADDCNSGPLEALDDHVNLRCFDQKARFGIDFLYPIDRYVTGLTAAIVPDRQGNLVPNPLFTNLDPTDPDATVRTAALVFLGSISGVPWQDIARRDAGGLPDLATGHDAKGAPVGGFKSAAELVATGAWDLILGTPEYYHTSPNALPDDPLMRESIAPRSGANPVTGDLVAPPSAGPMANPINGHEYTVAGNGDLQYACIFPLPTPRDCSQPGQVACDCDQPGSNNPLCQEANGSYGTTQFRAKAYPGIRQLSLLKALGNHGVVGSICPPQLTVEAELDYGYVPTVRTLVEAMAPQLAK